MDGLDVITRKIDSLAAEATIKAIGNDQRSTIGHGDLNADPAATLEKVAGTLVEDPLRIQRARTCSSRQYCRSPDPFAKGKAAPASRTSTRTMTGSRSARAIVYAR